jgi:alkaline phosphatase
VRLRAFIDDADEIMLAYPIGRFYGVQRMKRTNSLTRMLSALFAVAVTVNGASGFGAGSHTKGRRRPEVKNIIVMISDGCGYNHVDAASLYEYGRTGRQPYEHFRIKLAMSTCMAGQTYDPDKAWSYFNYVAKTVPTDSAAAATAMSTGVKTYKGAIGVYFDAYPLWHVADAAEQGGKATGLVTSVQLSHATPAAFVAHNESRNNYEEIANEMFYDSALEVIMGCGHPLYTNNNAPGYTRDSDDDGVPDTYQYKYVGGESTWIDLSDGSLTGESGVWTVIEDRLDFTNLMTGPTPDRVIGIAQAVSTLQYRRRGALEQTLPHEVPLNEGVPTLEEMTAAALNVLDNDPDGFFLVVEGGAIDSAAHGNNLVRLIEEQIDFNRAVETVVSWVERESRWRETLVIVTADHECGYLTGVGSGPSASGVVWNELVNHGRGSVPGGEFHSGGHTNALVPFYAHGIGSRRFRGRARSRDPVRGRYIDNTDVAEVIFRLLQ